MTSLYSRFLLLLGVCAILIPAQQVTSDEDNPPDPPEQVQNNPDDDDRDLRPEPPIRSFENRNAPEPRRPRRAGRRGRHDPGEQRRGRQRSNEIRPDGRPHEHNRKHDHLHSEHGPPERHFGLRNHRDPEMSQLIERDRELERRTRELAAQLRHGAADSNAENTEDLKNEIADTVREHFAARQERRELELKRLTEHLERLKHSFERRNEASDEIISRRISELTGEEYDLSF